MWRSREVFNFVEYLSTTKNEHYVEFWRVLKFVLRGLAMRIGFLISLICPKRDLSGTQHLSRIPEEILKTGAKTRFF